MRVEWIILADAAEVVNKKLYLMGGGWDRLTINQDFPVQQIIAVAVSFEIGWDETNIRQPMQIVIEDEEEKQLARINGEIEAGRPTGISPGQPQRIQLAFRVPLRLEHEGFYTVTARIFEEEVGRTGFMVVKGSGQRRQRRGQRKREDLQA